MILYSILNGAQSNGNGAASILEKKKTNKYINKRINRYIKRIQKIVEQEVLIGSLLESKVTCLSSIYTMLCNPFNYFPRRNLTLREGLGRNTVGLFSFSASFNVN